MILFMRCEHLGAGQEDEYGEYERGCPNCHGVFEDGEYEVEVDGHAFEEELKGLRSCEGHLAVGIERVGAEIGGVPDEEESLWCEEDAQQGDGCE